MEGDLALCPKAKGARHVLDMGTGTGSWAMDYGKALFFQPASMYPTQVLTQLAADIHPEAEVRSCIPRHLVILPNIILNLAGHWG